MDTDKTDDDLSHNVTQTPLNDSSVHWMSLDHNVSLEKHKRPIFEVGEILNGNIRARVMPPNRIEKITRDDSAIPGRVRSLPSRLFSKNICYQQKVQPIGTAKGRRRLDQKPLKGRSKSVHDISTEIESASALERAANVNLLKSAMKFFPNDEEIIMTASNITTQTIDLDTFNGNRSDPSAVTKVLESAGEELIVPTTCHLCFEVRAKPVDSERNTSGLNSPSSLTRSDSVSSISSSSYRERGSAQSKAEVINEIIKALSSVSFEGSNDVRPTEAVRNTEARRPDITSPDHKQTLELNGNLLEPTTTTATETPVAHAAPAKSSERASEAKPTNSLPSEILQKSSKIDADSGDLDKKSQIQKCIRVARPPQDLNLGPLPPTSEMTQSLHRAPLKLKRASPVEALKMSWSCNDINSHTNSRREVVPEVSGPLFKDSQSQTMFRIEPIGVLWEMASQFPSRTVPLFAECRPGQRANIFKQLRRRPRGGSLEDNTMDYSSEDSIPDTSDKGVGPDETLEDVSFDDKTFRNLESTRVPAQEVAPISRSRSEERGIAWEILLNSAQPREHMTLQEAFDVHCEGVKERSRSRLEKVAHIKTQRYDRDKIFEQYVNLLPPHQKLKIDKSKILLDVNGNRQPVQRKKQKSRKQNSLEKRKRTNRIAADIYKNRVRYEVLAGKTTFPVNKILLC